MDDFDEMFSISDMSGGFYISGIAPITNKEYRSNLSKNNIRVVVSITEGPVPILQSLPIIYIHYKAMDLPDFHIENLFDTAYEDISPYMGKQGILFHCMAGQSRSATIYIALMLNKYKHMLRPDRCLTNEILCYMKTKRKCIQPNEGFLKKLYEYENKLRQRS